MPIVKAHPSYVGCTPGGDSNNSITYTATGGTVPFLAGPYSFNYADPNTWVMSSQTGSTATFVITNPGGSMTVYDGYISPRNIITRPFCNNTGIGTANALGGWITIDSPYYRANSWSFSGGVGSQGWANYASWFGGSTFNDGSTFYCPKNGTGIIVGIVGPTSPPVTYSITTNNSGGSINPTTGAYTAGPNAGVDTITLTDSLAATATVQITVQALSVTLDSNSSSPSLATLLPGGKYYLVKVTPASTGLVWNISPNTTGASIYAVQDEATNGHITVITGNVAGTDTITVTDQFGNTGSLNITTQALISIVPAGSTVAPLSTTNFTATGGSGAYTWAITTNNSGGTINSSTGVYTAGALGLATDTIRCTDASGSGLTSTTTISTSAQVAITPNTISAAPRQPITFSASGGSGTGYVWSIIQNNSGATFTDGAYTAGPTGSVTDIIKLVDSVGASITRSIAITAALSTFPANVAWVTEDTSATFLTVGGGGGNTWAITVNNSGGTINSSTGVYTAGSTLGVDTVTVTDIYGTVKTISVNVTALYASLPIIDTNAPIAWMFDESAGTTCIDSGFSNLGVNLLGITTAPSDGPHIKATGKFIYAVNWNQTANNQGGTSGLYYTTTSFSNPQWMGLNTVLVADNWTWDTWIKCPTQPFSAGTEWPFFLVTGNSGSTPSWSPLKVTFSTTGGAGGAIDHINVYQSLGAPPVLIGSPTTTSTTGSANLTPALPADITDGDLLIALHSSRDNIIPTANAGWTFHLQQAGGSTYLSIAWARYKAAAPNAAQGEVNTACTFTRGTNTAPAVATCVAYRNVMPYATQVAFSKSNPFSFSSASGTNSSTTSIAWNTPNATGSFDYPLYVVGGGTGDSVASFGPLVGTTATELVTVGSPANAGGRSTLALWYDPDARSYNQPYKAVTTTASIAPSAANGYVVAVTGLRVEQAAVPTLIVSVPYTPGNTNWDAITFRHYLSSPSVWTLEVWVNGVLAGSSTHAFPVIQNIVGTNASANVLRFYGMAQLDQTRVSNKKRTDQEIADWASAVATNFAGRTTSVTPADTIRGVQSTRLLGNSAAALSTSIPQVSSVTVSDSGISVTFTQQVANNASLTPVNSGVKVTGSAPTQPTATGITIPISVTTSGNTYVKAVTPTSTYIDIEFQDIVSPNGAILNSAPTAQDTAVSSLTPLTTKIVRFNLLTPNPKMTLSDSSNGKVRLTFDKQIDLNPPTINAATSGGVIITTIAKNGANVVDINWSGLQP